MTAHIKNMWEELWDHAEGRGRPETFQHIDSCVECKRTLAEIQKMLCGLEYPNAEPPTQFLDAAYSIMPVPLRRLSIFGSSLQMSGARKALTDDFQLIFGDESIQLRVMYSPSGANWDVMTSLPDATCTAMKNGETLEIGEDSRLVFTVQSLEDSDFVVVANGEFFHVPSSFEVLRDRE